MYLTWLSAIYVEKDHPLHPGDVDKDPGNDLPKETFATFVTHEKRDRSISSNEAVTFHIQRWMLLCRFKTTQRFDIVV